MAINMILDLIKKQTGLVLQEDAHFSGVRSLRGENYFNVELDQRVSESREFAILERLAQGSKTITRVEPNGLSRVAVFFNEE